MALSDLSTEETPPPRTHSGMDELDRVLTSEQRDRLETNAESEFRTQLFEAEEVDYLLTADGLEWAGRHGLRNVGEMPDNLAWHLLGLNPVRSARKDVIDQDGLIPSGAG